MKRRERKAVFGLIFTLLLSLIFLKSVKAEYSANPHIVGLWHLDEVNPDGYRGVTPDAVGKNSTTLGGPSIPELVKGKFDKALRFDGQNFVYVPISYFVVFPPSPHPLTIPVSPPLDIQEEIQIEAWIKVEDFKNVTYNNVVAKCTHTEVEWQNTTRICGLSVKAGLPQNGHSFPRGALSGCVFTDTGGFNEIVITEPVVPLNQWVHVAFTRSLATGMHLYVDGEKKDVQAIYGVQTP